MSQKRHKGIDSSGRPQTPEASQAAGHGHWRVRTQRPVEYDIAETTDIFHPDNPALLSHGRVEGGRRFVVLDENASSHCVPQVQNYFSHHGIECKLVLFPGGEENKTKEHFLAILRALDAFPIHRRDDPIIAIGGGVLTDVAGFVASSYRRGVPHIKVPTTLMGYVDASVGVKTGINFNGHKNRLGSFEPPSKVILDRSFLTTLPARHLRNGLCEIIKLAIIKDAGLFELLENAGAASLACAFQDEPGAQILNRSIVGMLEELEPNLFESELARKADFGHTFSYGLETFHTEDLLHGEAVLLDMIVSVQLACRRGLLAATDARRIFRLLDTLQIRPAIHLLDTELIWGSLQDRIYHRNGLQRVPVPKAIGQCMFLNDITRQEIAAVIRQLTESNRSAHEPIHEC